MARDPYVSTGPYLTTYEWAGHSEEWNSPTLDEALIWFWQDGRLSQPLRRAICDRNGREIVVETP